MTPAISIIIPLYNAAKFIEATLRSVQQQTFTSFEVLIIDDGSTDGSAARCQAILEEDERFILFRQKNAGVSATRNFGAAVAQAPYLAFLDADDTWHPSFLATLHQTMDAKPHVAIAFAGVRFMDAEGAPTGATARPRNGTVSTLDLLAGNPTTTCSNLFVRRAAFNASLGFQSGLNHAEDQLWLLEMHLAGHVIMGQPQELVNYRTNATGLSADTRAMAAGWDTLAAYAMVLAPHLVRPALPAARARNRLYLAQRAWRTRRSPSAALRHGFEAARSHLPTVMTECAQALGKVTRRMNKKG